MKDEQKSKTELIQELTQLRSRVLQLEEAATHTQDNLPLEDKNLLAILMDVSADAIITVNEQFQLLTFNQGAEKTFGYLADEVVGKSINVLLPESYHDLHQQYMIAFGKEAKKSRLMGRYKEIIARRKNGDLFPAEASIAVQIIDGQMVYSVSLRDITHRVQAETKLQESESLYKQVVDSASESIVITDKNGRFLFLNPAAAKPLGGTPEEFIGKTFWDFLPSHMADTRMANIRKVFETGVGRLVEVPLAYRGETHWFMANTQPIKDSSGKITAVLTLATDITNRKQVENTLRESEERFRLAFENANVGVCMVDMEGNLIRVNKQMCQIFGYSQDVLEKMTVYDIAHPDDVNVSPEFIEHSLSGEVEVSTFEKRYFHKEGHIIWGRVSSSLVKDANGAPDYLISHVQDITQRHRAEEALKTSESRATALLEAIPDMMFRMNREGVYLDYRAERLALYAQSVDTIIGKKNRDIVPAAFADLVDKKIAQTLATAQMQTFEYELPVAERGLVQYEARMVKSGADEVIAIVRDITEKRKLEEERLKANKMESLGLLAGGIAHDFNNLLTGLYGNLELAKMFVKKDHRAHKYLETAERSMGNAVRLTNQLLTFAKGGEPIKEQLALSDLIQETAEFSLRGSNVKLKTDIAPDLWLVEADKGQLSQVISNLVINAQEAMPMGGLITIVAHNREHGSTYFVEIQVQDQGVGIPQKYLDKIFDPYFSTKQKGSGLGLATSYSIIHKHNGRIWVESEPNKGTRFTMQIPALAKSGALLTAQQSEDIDFSQQAPASILVLDDEEVVREAIGGMLEAIGHRVEFARDGEACIAKYKNAQDAATPYDLVITDLTIPGGMGGQDAAQQILHIHPDAKIIVSSGYATDPIMANYKQYGFKGIVVKPYRFIELQEVVRQVLSI